MVNYSHPNNFSGNRLLWIVTKNKGRERVNSFVFNALYRIWVFVLLFSWCVITNAQEKTSRLITMQEAVTMALQNNPKSQNAERTVKLAEVQRGSIFDIGKTQFNYQYGQINTGVIDRFFEIKQSFGSPVSYAHKARLVNSMVGVAEAEQHISINEVSAQVKMAWFQWLVTAQKLALLSSEISKFDTITNDAIRLFEMDSISVLERTIAETQYAEMQSQLFDATQNYTLALNQLILWVGVDDNFVPAENSIELYAIDTEKADNTKFIPEQQLTMYQKKYEYQKSKIGWEQSKYFPEVTLGYFNQKIDGIRGFQGISAGVALPLWYGPQKTKVKEAQLQAEIAQTDYAYQKLALSNKIEELQIKLDQLFVQISFYRENALKLADLLEETAQGRYQSKSISFTEYLQSLQKSISIKTQYLDKMLQYNITAVELEFFIK